MRKHALSSENKPSIECSAHIMSKAAGFHSSPGLGYYPCIILVTTEGLIRYLEIANGLFPMSVTLHSLG